MDINGIFDPTWIQRGEIGALFIGIILAAYITMRVVSSIIDTSSNEKAILSAIISEVNRKSEDRENRLMEFVLGIKPSFEAMLESQKSMLASQKSMERRVAIIEAEIREHFSSHKSNLESSNEREW